MSWCRWSTDIDNKYNSDLYIYDSVGDVIAVHVAGRKRANYGQNPYPEKPWSYYKTNIEGWQREYITDNALRQQWFEDNEEWTYLPEEYAGKDYNFGYDEMDSLKEFLIQARKDGINFPDYIFDYVEEVKNGAIND
jgi:hypothetical protein